MIVLIDLQIVRAQTDAELERNRVERIKTNVYRLEDSGKTKVTIQLQNGKTLKGYITRTGEDSFDVTNYKTQQTIAIAYRDVAQVKPRGGSSKGMKTVLTVVGAAAFVVLVLTLPRGNSPICPLGCRSF